MKNLFLALFVLSCSHVIPPSLTEDQQQFPSWVYAPYDFCSELQELCATGEGPNANSSDLEARNNLASIFKTDIGSGLHSITEDNSIHQMELKVKSQAMQSLKTVMDEVLGTIQIKKRFQKEGVYYSLAELDRDIAATILNRRVKKIDQELMGFWKRQQRTLIRKMLKLSAERALIEAKLAILTPVFEPAPISYQQILDWGLSPAQPQYVSLKVGHAPKWLVSKLSSLLGEVGYKVSNQDAKDVISINVTSIKELLNMEGTEKYTFTLNIVNIQNGKNIGELSKVETVIGKNQEDALLKVRNSFNEYLEEQLYQLNLD